MADAYGHAAHEAGVRKGAVVLERQRLRSGTVFHYGAQVEKKRHRRYNAGAARQRVPLLVQLRGTECLTEARRTHGTVGTNLVRLRRVLPHRVDLCESYRRRKFAGCHRSMPPHTESSAALRIGTGAQQRSGWSEHGLGGWQAWGTTRACAGDDGDFAGGVQRAILSEA